MSSNHIKLSPKILGEIEEAFNTILFFGIPVGATLNDVLIIDLYNSKRAWNWRSKLSDYIRYHKHKFYQPKFSSTDFTKYTERIVFTWLFDRVDLKAFIYPLVENYGYDDSIVIAPLSSMRGQLSNKQAFILWNDFPRIDMQVWRKEFNKCLPLWRYQLNKVFKTHGIPNDVGLYLLCHLQVETQRIMAALLFLEAANPKAIVTEYDRNSRAAPLILAARSRGIPTVAMIHSFMGPFPAYGDTPILADFICCWGDNQKEQLLKYGEKQQKLIITGCQRHTRTLEMNQADMKAKISIPVDRPMVMLATSPIKKEDRKHIASVFCDAMSRLPEISAVVRIHPGEVIHEYRAIIDKYPKVLFLSNEIMTQDESLAAADIIVNHESRFGADAILKRKLVIILDVLAPPLEFGKELGELAGCPIVKSSGELESVIRKIILNDDIKKELHVKAEKYALHYCESYGQDAVNNVCRVIDDAIVNSGLKPT